MIRLSISSTTHSQRRRYSAREAAEAAVSVRIRIFATDRSAERRCLLSRARRWAPLTRTLSLAHEAPPHRAPPTLAPSIGEGDGLIRPPSAVDCRGSLSRGSAAAWARTAGATSLVVRLGVDAAAGAPVGTTDGARPGKRLRPRIARPTRARGVAGRRGRTLKKQKRVRAQNSGRAHVWTD
jgi:hypothetical protein